MTKAKQSLEQPKQEQTGPQQQGGQGNQPPQGMSRRESYAPSMWGGSFSPFSMMSRFADEMDRMFENFGFGRGALGPWAGQSAMSTWSPQIEVFERNGQFIVRADLPGLTKDDVKVEVTDDALTIQGERKQEHEESREGWHRSERSYGSFFRSIPLPEGISAEEAKANFHDGVLEITMPAPQRQGRSRSIEIK